MIARCGRYWQRLDEHTFEDLDGNVRDLDAHCTCKGECETLRAARDHWSHVNATPPAGVTLYTSDPLLRAA